MALSSDEWKVDEDETVESLKVTEQEDDPEWRVVGSRSRRESLSRPIQPQQQHDNNTTITEKLWDSLGGIEWEGPLFENDSKTTPFFSTKETPSPMSFSVKTAQEEKSNITPTSFTFSRTRSLSSNAVFDSYFPYFVNTSQYSLGFDLPFLVDPNTTRQETYTAIQRRMSQPLVATDYLFSNSKIVTPLESLSEDFNKSRLLQDLPPHSSLYMIEFKSGRTGFYYKSVDQLVIRQGDKVIVEADRGYDLGKVATDTLTANQVRLLQQQQKQRNRLALLDENTMSKDIQVNRIQRLATEEEIFLLKVKMQDEKKALSLCQQKIQVKKLPMEVVDAEFQWDRRKLTFYYIAEKRIDFRELVKDLFKTYKIRIWMCAAN